MMSLDFHKPLTTTKKMRKRKELDALVSSEKLGSKYTVAAGPNGVVSANGNLRANGTGSGGGSGALGRKSSRHSHQLLEESGTNSENEIQQGELSGDGEVYAQVRNNVTCGIIRTFHSYLYYTTSKRVEP